MIFFRWKHQSILVAWDWKDKNLNQSKKLFAYKRCLHDSQKSTKWQYLLLWLLVKFQGLLIDTTLCYVLETACVQESSTSFDISHIVYNAAQLPIVDCHFPDLLLRVRRTPLGDCQVKRCIAAHYIQAVANELKRIFQARGEMYRVRSQMSRKVQRPS